MQAQYGGDAQHAERDRENAADPPCAEPPRRRIGKDPRQRPLRRAAQGRIDAFFLGGGQIDGAANINLVGVGGYPQSRVRWPGSFGSAYLYFLVPRVILARSSQSETLCVPWRKRSSRDSSIEPSWSTR